ncbi:helix-turn-helix domain-containing protein [Thalassoroseus pseudoceratinae]|uniref:helix-turn-helix domain-containing protein n=1 Tax=Thalassoroseus pseudoceratinae TaxID=2713176 RepID=UPI001420D80D
MSTLPQDSHQAPEYLSPAEFARRSGLSEPTVRRYVKNGKLPSYQPGGHRCRISIPASALRATVPSAPASVSSPQAEQPKRIPGPRPSWTQLTPFAQSQGKSNAQAENE